MHSKLDIINSMLASIGVQKLTTAQNRHPIFIKAETKLSEVKSAVQLMSLWYNTEVRIIQPQTDGQVYVPDGCIRADPADASINLVLRGNRMYDPTGLGYQIGKPVNLRMVFELPLEETAASVLEYIRARAVHSFYRDESGGSKLADYRSEQDRAWVDVNAEHTRNVQANLLNSAGSIARKLTIYRR